jgi:hypothetical protein
MNIALVLQHKLLLGIQRLVVGTPGPKSRAPSCSQNDAPIAHAPREATLRSHESYPAAVVSPLAKKVMPLRVLRVVEKGQPRSCTGRLVISGRMADVCAELDRLVAREAAIH